MLYYISFATDDEFLGAVFTQGDGPHAVLERLARLGINPGGEALVIEVPDEGLSDVPMDVLDVLLSRIVLEELTGPAVQVDAELYEHMNQS